MTTLSDLISFIEGTADHTVLAIPPQVIMLDTLHRAAKDHAEFSPMMTANLINFGLLQFAKDFDLPEPGYVTLQPHVSGLIDVFLLMENADQVSKWANLVGDSFEAERTAQGQFIASTNLFNCKHLKVRVHSSEQQVPVDLVPAGASAEAYIPPF